jgi:hypothetical protein
MGRLGLGLGWAEFGLAELREIFFFPIKKSKYIFK